MHLEGAKLPGANLSVAYLQGAYLDGCNLNYANLQKAHLQGAYLRKGTTLGETTLRHANLVCADLKNAHLEGADLTGAFLTTAHLEGAHFEEADLRSAHLETAIMTDAHLEGANLQWAHLDNAYMKGAHLGKSRLDDASLKGAYLIGAELPEVAIRKQIAPDVACLELSKICSSEGANIDGAYMTEEQLASPSVQFMVGIPETVQARMARLRKEIRQGKKEVLFGYYAQGAEGEILPLRWRVLTVVDRSGREQALIVTDRLVDCRPYHDVLKPITWKDCGLRKWLNEVFFYDAFCKEEQLWIARNEIPNPDNPFGNTKGCEPTTDNIFALSIDEVKKYFAGCEERMAAATPYAIRKGALVYQDYKLRNEEEAVWWWLRSPGHDSPHAAYVSYDGGVSELGNVVYASSVSVRPALWLNL